MLWIEIIGYVGSIFVAISLMMKNILKLRIINMLGALFFMTYSLILMTYPIFIVNLIICIVDLYYVYTLLTKEELFSMISLQDNNSPFLTSFIRYYYEDIIKFFPSFSIKVMENAEIAIICRDMVPVGLFASKAINNTQIEVLIDYIIPKYRDFKNAEFVYRKEMEKYLNKGYDCFITYTDNGIHKTYLKKIGYKRDRTNERLYIRHF
ncbi:MAG: hypothetical protein BAJALOKI1v1_620009 [Promethearchaeota archaeon]|nr:MAG: hypothetical protein BAJALOKI1v1_620009 [Candidatus Lokiarchaeota archaeon]